MNRSQQGDTITREADITRGDQSVSTRSARNEQGAIMNIESGQGESVTLARDSDGGDLYAASDGNVYKRSDDGWSQHDGTDWQPVEPSESQAERIEQGRSQAQERVQGADATQGAGATRESFADSLSRRQAEQGRSGAGSLSSRSESGFDTNRSRELDRSYNARSNGYSRFNSRQGSRGRGRR